MCNFSLHASYTGFQQDALYNLVIFGGSRLLFYGQTPDGSQKDLGRPLQPVRWTVVILLALRPATRNNVFFERRSATAICDAFGF